MMFKKSEYIFILFFLFLITPVLTYSQEFEEFGPPDDEEIVHGEVNQKKIDPKIEAWYLNGDGAFQDSTKIDTLIDNFQIYNPVFQNSITSTYIGNYGAPALDNDFFNRKSTMDFLFLQSREVYLLTPSKILYYNTRTPYTRLDFSQSENRVKFNETRFNVFHSQNVNPYLNVTLKINLGKSAGQYNYQENRNNFITLYSSYNTDKLDIYGGFISDLINNNENGGITNDTLIFNGAETNLIPTNLEASSTKFNSTYFFLKGEYRLGKTIKIEKEIPEGLTEEEEKEHVSQTVEVFRPIFGVLYNMEYQRHKQEFVEEENADSVFFENTYYNFDGYTKDSIRFNKISNIIQLKQYENANRKVSFSTRAFLGHETEIISMPGPLVDTISHVDRNYTNIYAGGGIFREKGKFWTWDFDGRIYFVGRRSGQTELNGFISKPLSLFKDTTATFSVSGNIKNIVADVFQDEFYSNHFQWDNNMKMEQRMEVNGSFISPKHKLKLSANYAIINNFIYNNEKGIPAQTDKELLILSAFADKDFNYRGLHFRTRILWQQASNEEFIHLPDFSAFISAYYKFVISKVMYTQLGVDTRYNTKYYADKYSPATGLFYLQSEKKYGNYPYIDVYANLRLKRTTVFFKMMNLGTQFLNGEYITSPNYPMPRSTFRLGLSWVFYD
ncbi:MAG: putative porin [Draconibacterium sp.]